MVFWAFFHFCLTLSHSYADLIAGGQILRPPSSMCKSGGSPPPLSSSVGIQIAYDPLGDAPGHAGLVSVVLKPKQLLMAGHKPCFHQHRRHGRFPNHGKVLAGDPPVDRAGELTGRGLDRLSQRLARFTAGIVINVQPLGIGIVLGGVAVDAYKNVRLGGAGILFTIVHYSIKALKSTGLF